MKYLAILALLTGCGTMPTPYAPVNPAMAKKTDVVINGATCYLWISGEIDCLKYPD
jgi:uncharacterized lipoprotein YajG